MAASLILIFGFQHSETERGLPTLLFMAFPVQKDRMTKLPTAPLDPPRTYRYELHGYTVDDTWFWQKDPGYPKAEDKEVLDYLKAVIGRAHVGNPVTNAHLRGRLSIAQK